MKKIRSGLTAIFLILVTSAAVAITAGAQTQQELAEKGYAIAQKDPALAKFRTDGLLNGLATDAKWLTGFDIATAIFGDPMLGGQGNTVVGPGALKYRNALTPSGQKGFDDSVKFHLGRHYKRNAGEVYATDRKAPGRVTPITEPNEPDHGHEIRCRGGVSYGEYNHVIIGFEILSSRQTSTGETINTMLLTAEPAPIAAGLNSKGLSPAECAWVDRPIDVIAGENGYQVRIRFETPANAQLSQVRHGTPVDTSPTAAERFPDTQSIPEYFNDRAHYWSFFDVRQVGNYFVATTNKYWVPETTAVKLVERVKLPPGTPPSPPIAICDAAGQARARNSPATVGLEAQCLANLAARGLSIAQTDSIVARLRAAEADDQYQRGFDIATGIFGDPALGAQGNTALGPGSLRIRDSLSAAGKRGFDASVKLHLSRNYKP